MNPPLRFDGDSAIIDPEIQYKIDPAIFVSKCKNTPFTGMKVQGGAFLTMVDGRIVYQKNK
jgi:dihydroorotase